MSRPWLPWAVVFLVAFGCQRAPETAPSGWVPDLYLRNEARMALGQGVEEVTLKVAGLRVGEEDAYYRISEPVLVRDVLTFLTKACQKGDALGHPKTCEGYLYYGRPERRYIRLYEEDHLMGPGWGKLWDRMRKEGKRIPPLDGG